MSTTKSPVERKMPRVDTLLAIELRSIAKVLQNLKLDPRVERVPRAYTDRLEALAEVLDEQHLESPSPEPPVGVFRFLREAFLVAEVMKGSMTPEELKDFEATSRWLEACNKR